MKIITTIVCLLMASGLFAQGNTSPKILVFSATKGFRHNSIPDGKLAIMKLGKEHGFAVDTTENPGFFSKEGLKNYKAVVFLSTTGSVLNMEQQENFTDYIHNGGGFVGVHAATDTHYDWPWFNKLVGAQFASHPKMQDADLHVTDSTFIATNMLPKVWRRHDEWYNFKNYDWESMHILMTIDENSYEGGKNDGYHPMSWYHNYDGGRSFYTALGHSKESFTEPLFLQHLLGGIKYAMGMGE